MDAQLDNYRSPVPEGYDYEGLERSLRGLLESGRTRLTVYGANYKITDVLAALKTGNVVLSYEHLAFGALHTNGHTGAGGGVLPTEAANFDPDGWLADYSQEDQLHQVEDREYLNNYLNLLDERTELVITMIFGLDGQSPLTQEEVAKELSLSQQRVGQIYHKGLRQLREFMIMDSMRDEDS